MDGDMTFDDRLNTVVDTILAEDDKKGEPSDASAQPNPAAQSATGEAEPSQDANAIGEDQDKSNEDGKGEPSQQAGAIEPPASWPSDDKEAFRNLPTWAQERIVTREQEREAAFSQRSRTLATRERELTDIQTRANEAQTRLSGELERLNQLAAQLMPAKFSDIRSEADYLRLKQEDPARASQYEAFIQILNNNAQKLQQVNSQRMQEQLNREYSMLVEKDPVFKDTTKAQEILTGVRKAAVDFYGFAPQEVEVIADHRHVQVLRDAMAWRNYQANLKAAAAKKTAPQLTPVLRQTGAPAGSVAADQKAKILNRARNVSDMREKADLIATLL